MPLEGSHIVIKILHFFCALQKFMHYSITKILLNTEKTPLLPNMLLFDWIWSTIHCVARVLSQQRISVFSVKNKQLQSLLSVQHNSPLNAGQSRYHTM